MHIARTDFMEITGIAPERLQEILALGWIEATSDAFHDNDIYRVKKLERICCDFELPVLGGTIIVDLLERIDELERTVKSLQGMENA